MQLIFNVKNRRPIPQLHSASAKGEHVGHRLQPYSPRNCFYNAIQHSVITSFHTAKLRLHYPALTSPLHSLSTRIPLRAYQHV
jgi:hypothetical protein